MMHFWKQLVLKYHGIVLAQLLAHVKQRDGIFLYGAPVLHMLDAFTERIYLNDCKIASLVCNW